MGGQDRPACVSRSLRDAGRVAVGAGDRNGIGTAAAAGDHDYRRIDREPDADVVYDSGGLSVFPTGCRTGGRGVRNMRRRSRV